MKIFKPLRSSFACSLLLICASCVPSPSTTNSTQQSSSIGTDTGSLLTPGENANSGAQKPSENSQTGVNTDISTGKVTETPTTPVSSGDINSGFVLPEGASSLKIEFASNTLSRKGDTMRVSAQLFDNNGKRILISDLPVRFTSSHPNIISVSTDGLLQAVASSGSAEISVQIPGTDLQAKRLLFIQSSSSSSSGGSGSSSSTPTLENLSASVNFQLGGQATGEISPFAVKPSVFLTAGLVGDIQIEDCTLSGGTQTQCYRISVNSTPSDHQTGPFCPPNINSTDAEGGIWFHNGKLEQVSGSFIENLSSFYNDAVWQLYIPEPNQGAGTIKITDTKESCALAARPDVDEQYQNYCVQCLPEYVDTQGEPTITYVIPVNPIKATSTKAVSGSGTGVALNGVVFDAAAPLEAILGAHTLAPFDDCGGHVNLVNGYHYHATTGCNDEIAQPDNHAGMIGYALDGYPMHTPLGANGQPYSDLDACSGHEDDIRGYHYHVMEPGKNQFLGCFSGETGCAYSGDGEGASCDATQVNSGPPGGPPDGGPPGGGPGGTPPDGPAFNTQSVIEHGHTHQNANPIWYTHAHSH